MYIRPRSVIQPGRRLAVLVVGLANAFEVLFPELVHRGLGDGIAHLPEPLDELVALDRGREAEKALPLGVRHDVDRFLVEKATVLLRKVGLRAQ